MIKSKPIKVKGTIKAREIDKHLMPGEMSAAIGRLLEGARLAAEKLPGDTPEEHKHWQGEAFYQLAEARLIAAAFPNPRVGQKLLDAINDIWGQLL